MSWSEIKTAYAALAKAIVGDADPTPAWQAFSDTVNRHADNPPYHLTSVLNHLKSLFGDRPRDSVVIVDHGCGGGVTLLYLAAIGYTNIYGIDVESGDCEKWNRLTRDILGLEGQRFFVYDGRELPFETDSADLLISQEVLEHVSDDVLANYYREGARVLKPDGYALYSVPHRLVPYESHSQTWILHCFLPRPAWVALLKRFNRCNLVSEKYLFLRWPWTHKQYLRRYFSSVEDITLDRVISIRSLDYYDGNLRLRNLIGSLVRMPVIGAIFGTVLRNLIMIDTLAGKPKQQIQDAAHG